MNPVDALMDRWRREAGCYERDGALVNASAILRRCAVELETVAVAHDNESLDLRAAAAESGYSPDHLGRLIRHGTLPNAGVDFAPRILRRNLPRKPGHGVPTPTISGTLASRTEIARSVLHEGGTDA